MEILTTTPIAKKTIRVVKARRALRVRSTIFRQQILNSVTMIYLARYMYNQHFLIEVLPSILYFLSKKNPLLNTNPHIMSHSSGHLHNTHHNNQDLEGVQSRIRSTQSHHHCWDTFACPQDSTAAWACRRLFQHQHNSRRPHRERRPLRFHFDN